MWRLCQLVVSGFSLCLFLFVFPCKDSTRPETIRLVILFYLFPATADRALSWSPYQEPDQTITFFYQFLVRERVSGIAEVDFCLYVHATCGNVWL